ncbi:MAG: hypothetical protein AAF446_10505, partial [Pseudomonadota bacterium]
MAETSDANPIWIKIHKPSAEFRQQLPDEAIDYGSFIWMPDQALARSAGQRIERIENPFAIDFAGQTLDPKTATLENRSEWDTSANHAEPDFRLVQFNGPIKNQWLDELRGAGMQPIQYRHPYSYIVWANASTLTENRSVSQLRWVGELLPAMRVPEQSRNSSNNHSHTMALIHAASAEAIVNKLRVAGITIEIHQPLNTHFHMLQIEALPERYLELARIPG